MTETNFCRVFPFYIWFTTRFQLSTFASSFWRKRWCNFSFLLFLMIQRPLCSEVNKYCRQKVISGTDYSLVTKCTLNSTNVILKIVKSFSPDEILERILLMFLMLIDTEGIKRSTSHYPINRGV